MHTIQMICIGQHNLYVCCAALPAVENAVLAYFVAAMSPNMDVANAALPVYVSTLLYFGGMCCDSAGSCFL